MNEVTNADTFEFKIVSPSDAGIFYISNKWINGCYWSINDGIETHIVTINQAVNLSVGDVLRIRISNQLNYTNGWELIKRPIIADRTEKLANTRFVKCLKVPDIKISVLPNNSVGDHFFCAFNYAGAVISLPEGSFDTSNISSVGDNFFYDFNAYSSLTYLPEGSFDTSNISSVGNHFFDAFNFNGKLTYLPEGSFDTSNISSVGDNFFVGFNHTATITYLPEGSFDTSNISSVGDNFFRSFNKSGAITSLPEGSFDTSNISSVGEGFFQSFNDSGKIRRDTTTANRITIQNKAVSETAFYYWDGAVSLDVSVPSGKAWDGYLAYIQIVSATL